MVIRLCHKEELGVVNKFASRKEPARGLSGWEQTGPIAGVERLFGVLQNQQYVIDRDTAVVTNLLSTKEEPAMSDSNA